MIAQREKCISPSVLSVARVMIAQWDNECARISLSVLPVAWAEFLAMAEYFKGFFPGWPIPVLSQCGRKWLNPLSMALHNL